MHTRILGGCGLVLVMATSAWAGPVILQAPALLERPGVVALDPRNVTTVQFCDQIGWSAFKAGWLHASVSAQDKHVLLLDASATSGEASMHVWLEGKNTPLQLLIRVSSSTLANHLYFVSCIQAPPEGGSRAVPPTAFSPAARPAAVPLSRDGAHAMGPASAPAAPGAPTRPGDALVTATPHPTPPAAPAPRSVSAGGGGPGSHVMPAGVMPPGVVWQVSTSTTLAGLVISYALTNKGYATVVLDASRLRVLSPSGTPVSRATLNRQDTSGFEGRVPPGGAEHGVIWAPAAPAGAMLRWPVVEMGTGLVYLINQRVS